MSSLSGERVHGFGICVPSKAKTGCRVPSTERTLSASYFRHFSDRFNRHSSKDFFPQVSLSFFRFLLFFFAWVCASGGVKLMMTRGNVGARGYQTTRIGDANQRRALLVKTATNQALRRFDAKFISFHLSLSLILHTFSVPLHLKEY